MKAKCTVDTLIQQVIGPMCDHSNEEQDTVVKIVLTWSRVKRRRRSDHNLGVRCSGTVRFESRRHAIE